MAWLGTGTAPAAPTTVPKTHTSSHVGLGHAVRAGAAAAKRARHRPHTLCRPGPRLEPNSLGRAQGAAGTARAPRLRSPPAVSPPRAALPSCGPSPAASPATAATRSPALRAPRAPERLSARRSAAGTIHTRTPPCGTGRCSWQASRACIIMSTYALRPGLVSVLLAPPGPPSSLDWRYAAAGSHSDTEPGPQAGHHLAASLPGPAGDSEPAASSARRLPRLARVLRPPRPPAGAPGRAGVRAATRPRQATPGLQAHVQAPQGPSFAPNPCTAAHAHPSGHEGPGQGRTCAGGPRRSRADAPHHPLRCWGHGHASPGDRK